MPVRTSTPTLLTISEVSKTYGQRRALDGISLSLFNLPKKWIEKHYGPDAVKAIEKWTAKYLEKPVRTMNDPTYGGAGLAGKTINEVTKGTGPEGDPSNR